MLLRGDANDHGGDEAATGAVRAAVETAWEGVMEDVGRKKKQSTTCARGRDGEACAGKISAGGWRAPLPLVREEGGEKRA